MPPILNIGQINDETVITPEGIRHSGGDWAGAFNTLQELQEWGDRNPNSLFVGLRATAGGAPYTYGAGGWGVVRQDGVVDFGMANFKIATKPRIFFFGDSNVSGQGAGNRLESFPSALANYLGWRDGAAFGTGGMGLSFDPRISFGSFNAAGKDSPGSLVSCSGVSATDYVFSPGVAFDSFDFWYPTLPAANTQVSILLDGVVIDTFSQSFANDYKKKSYSCIRGTHQISFRSTGTGTAFVSGIETHDSLSSSTEIVNCGISGAKMLDMISNASPWQNLKAINTLKPDVVVLHCTINELDNSVAPATLRGYIDTWANTIASYMTIDQALTVSWAWLNSSASTDGTLDNISEFLKKTASTYKGAWSDMRYVVGASGAQSSAIGVTADNWHLNKKGYAMYPKLMAKMFGK